MPGGARPPTPHAATHLSGGSDPIPGLGGGGLSEFPTATTAAAGAVKVDHNSAGDPVALTSAGHGAAAAPHSGHATPASVAAAITAHEALPNPHPDYMTAAEVAALGYADLDDIDAAIVAHRGEADPHPNYSTGAEVASAIAVHEAAADPHTQYQRESEKGVANGYASLGADGLVPSAQLPASSGGGLAEVESPGSMLRRGSVANRWNVASQITASPLVTQAVTLGRLYAFPLFIHRALRLQHLGFNVSTLVAASNGRIGLYTDDGNGYPAALITGSDVGLLATATAGFKQNVMPDTAAFDLLAGQTYWIAANFSHAITLRAIPVAACWPILGFDDVAATVAPGLGWIATLAFGALPAAYPAGAAIHTAIVPALYARYKL